MEITTDTIVKTGAKIIIDCIEEGQKRKKTIRLIGSTKKYILEKIVSERNIVINYQIA